MGDNASETSYTGPSSLLADPVAVGQSNHPAGSGVSGSPMAGIPNNPKQQPSQPQPQPPPLHQQHQQQHYGSQQNAFSSQFDMAQTRGSSTFNMNAMSNALPQGGYRPPYPPGGGSQPQARFHPGPHMPQTHQYAVQGVHVQNMPYYVQHHPGMQPQYYTMSVSPSPGNPQTRQHVGYYQGQMLVNQQQNLPHAYYYHQAGPYPTQNQPAMAGQHGRAVPGQPDSRLQTPNGMGEIPASPGQRPQSSDGRQGGVRGPPRKPKQSGHAIWIGNLPPQTDLMSLVQHVCKEAPGLESLFLISKSNCAFANFKDEQTCVSAQQKLHDSKFQSVRLVSRLRKSTVEGATGMTAPTGPSATVTTPAPTPAPTPGPTPGPGEPLPTDGEKSSPVVVHSTGTKSNSGSEGSGRDKFFILKSLTVEDLELSVRNGIWATQSHNEENLNHAFKNADNVYLVFSANKSGEYFGYARMLSEINDDPAAAIQFAPTVQSSNDTDLPKAIPTEATEFAPKGRIIDDSARGTIFWEVEREEEEASEEEASEDGSTRSVEPDGISEVDGEAGPKAWGKPFKLEWLSTTRLPFYRTRGLRNPWNSNREVKIARDGTELEPNVGRRLIGLFNRIHSPSVPPAVIRPGMGAIMGYPPMRPYPQ